MRTDSASRRTALASGRRRLTARARPGRARTIAAAGLLAGAWLAASPALAAKLVLAVRAGNPASFAQTVEVVAELPERVTTNDVLNAAGLDLEYDVKKDVYKARKAIEFKAGEIRVFRIEIRDIWIIQEADIQKLREHTRSLVEKLEGAESAAEAQELAKKVELGLDEVVARQKASTIEAGASPIQHIRDHETNVRVVEQLKIDIGQIENMVLGADKDPGELVGPSVAEPAPARRVLEPEGGFKMAVMEVSVANPSTSMPRRVSIRQELPSEILATDVVEAEGLQVGTDAASGRTFVYRESVELGPGERKSYKIKIKDKWNVNAPRVAALRKDAEGLRELVQASERYKSVEQVLTTMLADLDQVEKQVGPEKLSPAYVAFYRRQGERLDLAERTLQRIRSALRPGDMSSRLGGSFKPPSPKNTWVIIYIVLGFLALVSLVFFFRWFGRSKPEEMGKPGQS